jgi:hypothetical protein
MHTRFKALAVLIVGILVFAVSQAHAQESVPEGAQPQLERVQIPRHTQLKLGGAAMGGAAAGAAIATLAGGLTFLSMSGLNRCEEDDVFNCFAVSIGVTMGLGLTLPPLGAALAASRVGKRAGYEARLWVPLVGATVGYAVGVGLETGLIFVLEASGIRLSDAAFWGSAVSIGLVSIAASTALFYRLGARRLRSAPMLAPTAHGGFTAGISGVF